MLTPEQLDQLSHPLIDIYSKLETEIINSIVERLKTDKPDSITKDNVLHWQVEQLSKMHNLNKDVIKMLSLMSGRSELLVNTLIENVAHKSIKPMDDWLMPLAKEGKIEQAPLLREDQRVFNTLLTFQKQAKSQLNLVNAKILQSAAQVYRDIISKATAKTLVTGDFRTSLGQVASQWCDNGLPALTDSAGRNWTIEGYVPMVVKSTANNVANQVQFDRMDSYNLDLVEISSHAGARPGCAPYQGKIFSRNGASNDYPSLTNTTMGQAAGLFGINCHHMAYPYIEGVSKQRFKPYPMAENNELYKTFQQQRSIERDIRKAKRKLATVKALGSEEQVKAAKQYVRLHQANMRQFISNSPVTRRRDREQLHINNS